MALQSLNQLIALRSAMTLPRNLLLRLTTGTSLPASVKLSLSGRIRPLRRGSVTVGADTLIAFKTLIITRDFLTGEDRPVRIGQRCFIGGGSVILPGVTVGDESIVGAGAVVFDDVPPRSIVGGNPARVLRRDIEVVHYGRFKDADLTSRGWKAHEQIDEDPQPPQAGARSVSHERA
jgi:hypothetical protein